MHLPHSFTVGKGLENARLSARNILAEAISELNEGAVSSEVGFRLCHKAAVDKLLDQPHDANGTLAIL